MNANLTFDRINEQTGFANGAKFEAEQEVLDYFTVAAQRQMFGEDATLTQPELNEMAQAVLETRQWCNFD